MGLLQEQLRSINEAKVAEEKRQIDGSGNRKQYLLLMAEAAGYGTDVEAYIKAEKAKQPLLQPIGFWDYPDPANALGTTEEGLNPKRSRRFVKSKTTGKRLEATDWDQTFDPKNRK